MQLTLNILNDYISTRLKTANFLGQENNISFERIVLFSQKDSSLSNKYLYCTDLSLGIPKLDNHDDIIYFLCAGTEKSINDFRFQYPNIVVLAIDTEKYCLAEVFNLITDLFEKLHQWDFDLKNCIAAGGSFQDMLDCSEHLFRNPVFMIDYSFNLVAYTKNIPVSHPDLLSTIQNGIYPVKMVEELVNRRILEKVENFQTPDFFEPPNYINCTMIIKSFTQNAQRLNTICLYGLNSRPSFGSLDLVRHLSEVIESYLGSLNTNIYLSDDIHKSSFVSDCISGAFMTDTEIEMRASSLNLPYKGDFILRCVQMENYTLSHAHYIQQQLQSIHPESITFIYNEQVISLADCANHIYINKVFKKETQFIKSNNCYCGTSSTFSKLSDLKDAYHQAVDCISLGKLITPEYRLLFYNDYYVYHLFYNMSKDYSTDMICNMTFLSKIDHSSGSDSNNLDFLEMYLENDRNATATANAAHIHRNSVLYRIQKLEDTYNFSLDNNEFRLWLMLSIKAYKFFKLQKSLDKQDNTK